MISEFEISDQGCDDGREGGWIGGGQVERRERLEDG